MHSNSYTIFFTSIVTVVLGGFLSVAAGTLKETQELNVKNDSKKNILASLGFKPEGESKWSSDEITKLFEENIDAYVLNSNGERTSIDPSSIDTETDEENFPIYVDKRDGAVNGYAIPISEKGCGLLFTGILQLILIALRQRESLFMLTKRHRVLEGRLKNHGFKTIS